METFPRAEGAPVEVEEVKGVGVAVVETVVALEDEEVEVVVEIAVTLEAVVVVLEETVEVEEAVESLLGSFCNWME